MTPWTIPGTAKVMAALSLRRVFIGALIVVGTFCFWLWSGK